MRRGGMVAGLAAVAAVAVLAAVVGWVRSGDSSEPDVGADWRVAPEAFSVRDAWMTGPQVLIPGSVGCFVAFGRDSTGTGTVSAAWNGAGDCTSAVKAGAARRAPVDGLPSEDRASYIAGVTARDGGYLLLSRRTFANDAFGYSTAIMTGDPQRGFEVVTRFQGKDLTSGHAGPDAIVAMELGYVAVGRMDEVPTVWTSPDGGLWTAAALPGGGRATGLTLATGPAGRLVALGQRDGVLVGWASADSGQTWRTAELPTMDGRQQIWSMVHNGREFLALGGTGEALVLTSPDGQRWTRDDSATVAGAQAFRAATVMRDGSVLASAAAPGPGRTQADQCARAWRWDGHEWTSEAIGCHGVPDALVRLVDGRIAGAHWSTLFLRNP